MNEYWLFLIFTIPIAGYCAELSKNMKYEELDDFSGGLDTQHVPHKVPKNFSVNMRNVLIDEKPGSLVDRNGYIVSGSTNILSKINFFFIFYKEDGSKEYIVSDSSRVVSTKDFASYTVIRNTLTTISILSAAQGRNKVWFTNGSDPVFTWTGVTMTVLDGTGIVPNVPRGKFIVYYQERFHLFNTTGGASDDAFSALTSTDGVLIAPDDSRAWPPLNVIRVGQGDGENGSGMIVDKGQLYYHKDRSIWTLFGIDEFSYFPRKTNAQVGTVSNDSIALLDNYQYFLGKDGIYQFDGRDAVRISDLINPDIQAIVNNLTRIVTNDWKTKADWERGTMYGSTTSANILTSVQSFTANNSAGQANFKILANQANSPINSTPTFSNIPAANADWYLKTLTLIASVIDPTNLRFQFKNQRTGLTGTSVGKFNASQSAVVYDVYLDTDADRVPFSSEDFRASSITFSFWNFEGVDVFISSIPNSTSDGLTLTLIPSATAHFVSEVTTATTISYWDKFNSVNNTSQGTINYFIRTATSVVNITTQAYIAITPGAIINAPSSQNFIQWTSSMIRANPAVLPPSLTNVIIGHNAGGGNDTRAIGVNWKNRYWLAVSTISDGSLTLIYVKSKITNPNPSAWMVFSGINIKALKSDNFDTLYAGDSNNGKVFRLDYGTNDNGVLIDAFYDTPEITFGSNFFEKITWEYLFDMDKQNGNTFRFGEAINGSDFTYRIIDASGSGTLLASILNDTGNFGKTFKYRFQNNQLDKKIALNTFGIFYELTEVR